MFNYQGSFLSFSLQATTSIFYHVRFILSRTFLFFFFSAFLTAYESALIYYHFLHQFVKTFFTFFSSFLNKTFSNILPLLKSVFRRQDKRRRRDLNPRAAINDLLPFQGSPFGQLGYFSKMSVIKYTRN